MACSVKRLGRTGRSTWSARYTVFGVAPGVESQPVNVGESTRGVVTCAWRTPNGKRTVPNQVQGNERTASQPLRSWAMSRFVRRSWAAHQLFQRPTVHTFAPRVGHSGGAGDSYEANGHGFYAMKGINCGRDQ
jgi:hypothetical protein